MKDILSIKKSLFGKSIIKEVANYYDIRVQYRKKTGFYSFMCISLSILSSMLFVALESQFNNGIFALFSFFSFFGVPIIGLCSIENIVKKKINPLLLRTQLEQQLSNKETQTDLLQSLLYANTIEIKKLTEDLAKLWIAKEYTNSIYKIKEIMELLDNPTEKTEQKNTVLDYYMSLGLLEKEVNGKKDIRSML